MGFARDVDVGCFGDSNQTILITRPIISVGSVSLSRAAEKSLKSFTIVMFSSAPIETPLSYCEHGPNKSDFGGGGAVLSVAEINLHGEVPGSDAVPCKTDHHQAKRLKRLSHTKTADVERAKPQTFDQG